jgi:hypothetical protein
MLKGILNYIFSVNDVLIFIQYFREMLLCFVVLLAPMIYSFRLINTLSISYHICKKDIRVSLPIMSL